MATNKIAILLYLGQGEKGQTRKQALEALAAENNHFWGDQPSIGRWLISIADERINMAKIENQYPIGSKAEVSHPYLNEVQEAKIVNYTHDTVSHPQTSNPTGIMVKFSDGIYMEVDRNFLETSDDQ